MRERRNRTDKRSKKGLYRRLMPVLLVPVLMLLLYTVPARASQVLTGGIKPVILQRGITEDVEGVCPAAGNMVMKDAPEEKQEIPKPNYFRLVMFFLSPFLIMAFGVILMAIVRRNAKKKQDEKIRAIEAERNKKKENA